jgi:hypothetical protein
LIMPNHDEMLPEDDPWDTVISSLRLKFATRNIRKMEIFLDSNGSWKARY